jgi:DNA-binding response OmpR family regulator
MAEMAEGAPVGGLVISLWGVEIDGLRQRIGWDGAATRLPPREMSAMLALAADPGAPVASADLARHIWPGSVMVTAYDVRRIIYRLRGYLRKNKIPVTIENVRGLGYFLDLQPRRGI